MENECRIRKIVMGESGKGDGDGTLEEALPQLHCGWLQGSSLLLAIAGSSKVGGASPAERCQDFAHIRIKDLTITVSCLQCQEFYLHRKVYSYKQL